MKCLDKTISRLLNIDYMNLTFDLPLRLVVFDSISVRSNPNIPSFANIQAETRMRITSKARIGKRKIVPSANCNKDKIVQFTIKM